MLVLAGPYEFLADDPFLYGIYNTNKQAPPLPPAEDARLALAAHALLRVDSGWLSAKAAQWMRQAAGALPPGYAVVEKEPVVHIVETGIGKVGIVLFPEGPTPGKGPTPELEERVLAAGRRLQGQTALTLGVSPWGFVGERDFLPKAQGIFACILGSGEGVGFAFSVPEKNPGVLWLRPDNQGRAVNILELLQMPGQNSLPEWREGVTFNAKLEFLDHRYRPDPAMEQIIGRTEH